MTLKPCAHRDMREFDNLETCLECGETHFFAPAEVSGQLLDLKTQHKIDHDYDASRLRSGRDIRLVVLPAGNFIDAVTCIVIVADLTEGLEYEAIS